MWKRRARFCVGWTLRLYIAWLLVIPVYILCYVAIADEPEDADVNVYATPLIAPTVTTDSGATNILEESARLRGEITDTGNENPEVYVFWGIYDGGTDPGSWSDNYNMGYLGLGVFYHDISELTANTTYFYTCRAINTGGTDWPDTSANFTTLPTGSIIGVPSDFTVTDLGCISLNFEWTKGTNGYYTMIRGGRGTAPTGITEGELLYYGENTTANVTGFALDITEYVFSAWGFYSDNETHSETYATASAGGDFLEDLADAINGIVGALGDFNAFMLIGFTLVVVALINAAGLYRPENTLLKIITGPLDIVYGLLLADSAALSSPLWVAGVIIAVYGTYLIYAPISEVIKGYWGKKK